MKSKVDSNANAKKRKYFPIYLFFLIISLLTSVFAVYELLLLSSVETVIRYFLIGIIIVIDLFLVHRVKLILHPHRGMHNKRKSKHISLLLFMIFYSIILGLMGGVIYYVYGEISSLNKVFVTYTSNLITTTDSSVNKVSDVKNLKIGILEDESSIDGYIIPMDIVRENNLQDDNELVSYDDYTSMIVDLYSKEIDGCFVSSGYVNLFSTISGYENIQNDTKIIISKSKKLRKSDTFKSEAASSGKDLTEPFTMLLMGIDSTDEVLEENAVANGDTLILITFNPKTLNMTMLSIPRDSYVPIACWSNKAENKITHAAAYGNDCMINTIEDYFDVKIDYYAKINFKGLVKLVDALGGIEVDVEKELCTDNSNREYEVCIKKGLQTLNGEEALVYARNRKQLADGDFGRNYHQQVIVMSLINKVREIDDVTTFMNILNTISNSMDTNFTTKQILSFYNVGKDIIKKSLSSDDAELVNVLRLYLQGNGQMIYDERAKMVLWDYVPNEYSRKDIVQAMKENLELVDHEVIREFYFSINAPYEKEIIGYGPYKTNGGYNLLPDFTGDTQIIATATCNKLGIKCTFNGSGGTVISQSYPANQRIDKMKNSLVLTLSQNQTKSDNSSSSYIKEKDTSTDKKNNSKDKSNTKKTTEDDDEDESVNDSYKNDEKDADGDKEKDILEKNILPTPPKNNTENDED